MKKARIYTGTGDNGTTSLIGGTRVSKAHIRVEAYGTLDELNAHLGLLSVQLNGKEEIAAIEQIENDIFTIGCSLASEETGKYTLPIHCSSCSSYLITYYCTIVISTRRFAARPASVLLSPTGRVPP